MNRRQLTRLALAAAAAAAAGPWTGAAHAQSDKPISMVVGYAAGGSADFIARVVAAEMSKKIGRQIIIENVAGASGMIAVQKVLAAPADGTYIYMGGTDTVVIPMVNPKVKHDWERDFTGLGRLTTVPMIFAVPAASKFSSLSELIASVRKGGNDTFSYATPGIGTMQHFYGALINKQAHVSMLHIPYRGGSIIVNDLVGNQVDAAVLVLSTALPFLKDGKIKALSVSDTQRVSQLPNVKRIGEEDGFSGVALPLWQALFVKAGTPAALAASYEKALLDTMANPEVRSKLADSGVTAAPLNGAALKTFIKPQAALYREIVETAKISLD